MANHYTLQAPIPEDIEGFLKNSENKVNLNLMIAKLLSMQFTLYVLGIIRLL